MNPFLLVAAIVVSFASLMDGLSTVYFLKLGYSEANPLFGPHPSKRRVFLQGAAIISAEIVSAFLLAHRFGKLAPWLAAFLLGQSAAHFYFADRNFKLK